MSQVGLARGYSNTSIVTTDIDLKVFENYYMEETMADCIRGKAEQVSM